MTMKKRKETVFALPVPTEDEEQMIVIQWANLSGGKWPDLKWIYHTPNGGSRSKAEAARFKAMGVKAGVPDLFLPAAYGGYHGLYIEMKRRKGGKLSAEQKKWIAALIENDYRVERCDGWEEAVAVLEEYLRSGKEKKRCHI